ncbi:MULTISPECIES: hypothetical protein [Hyphomicrobiales]|jgi:hypothetical protein|uniref:Uncharacterized protein n=1 Tax=Bosea massiliensis TaxID=151419 RepID=A0ABW0NWA8_9HYPH|nr:MULTISPECIES: hypothetical protein [Hyphomicrobiales]
MKVGLVEGQEAMAHDGGGRLRGQGGGEAPGHRGAGCGFSIRRRI